MAKSGSSGAAVTKRVALLLGLLAAVAVAAPSFSAEGSKPGETPNRPAPPVERISFRQGSSAKAVEGRVLVEATDGGLLVESADGRLWTVETDHLSSRDSLDRSFQPLTPEALGKQLQADVGGG